MLKKCEHSKEDPYIALLNWRNTPQEGLDRKPVQRLTGQQTRTLLPTSHRLLQPGDTDLHKIREQIDNQKMKILKSQKDIKTLKPLKLNDPVRIQPINAQEEICSPARVKEQVNPRSHIAETNIRKYRRDIQFLRLERKPTTTVLSENATQPV